MSEINIRDFILNETSEEESGTSEKKSGPVAKKKAEYAVELALNPDFIISRTTTRTKQMLVFLVTQKQYYIKNNDGSVEALTADNFVKFMADYTPLSLDTEEIKWLDDIPRSKKVIENLLSFIDKMSPYIKNNLISFYEPAYESYYGHSFYNNVVESIDIVKELRSAFSEMTTSEFTQSLYSGTSSYYYGYVEDTFNCSDTAALSKLYKYRETLKFVLREFKVQNLRDFIETYKSLPIRTNLAEKSYLEYFNKEKITFEYQKFRDYVLYGAVSQGYACNTAGIFSEWADTLKMQKEVYTKIREKYPEHLASMHDKLSFTISQNRVAYDTAKWNKVVKDNKALEWECRDYILTLPTDRAALINEAVMQSSCVAGYFSSMLEGKTVVAFLRKKKDPTMSWVTVEIRKGEIVQAKAKFNRNLNSEMTKALERYSSESGIPITSM